MEGNFLFKEFFKNQEPIIDAKLVFNAPKNENLAQNRMFVWAFNRSDLNEFTEIFFNYRGRMTSFEARRNLKQVLLRKMRAMLSADYNPIECMLYASKILNQYLSSDTSLQRILAELIYDCYLQSKENSVAIIKNIFKMWTWTPQIKATILAVGMIGSNEELLDELMARYSHLAEYKKIVYYAMKEKHTIENTERILKIITSLGETDEDLFIGRDYQKESDSLGADDLDLIEIWQSKPGISKTGRVILTNILLRKGKKTSKNQHLYYRTLANRSAKDDVAYKEFEAYCYKVNDSNAIYLCRFSNPRIGDYLKQVIEDPSTSLKFRGSAIISLAFAGNKGYKKTKDILSYCEKNFDKNHEPYLLMANLLLGSKTAGPKMAELLSSKDARDLKELFVALKDSNLVNMQGDAYAAFQTAIVKEFNFLYKEKDQEALSLYLKNLSLFWNYKCYNLISHQARIQMCLALEDFLTKDNGLSVKDLLSMIDIVSKRIDPQVEETLIKILNNNKTPYLVQNKCHEKLSMIEVTPPKAN